MNLTTLKRTKTVEDGTIVLDVPKLDNGTKVEVEIIAIKTAEQGSKDQKQSTPSTNKSNLSKTENRKPTNGETNGSPNFESLGLLDTIVKGVIKQGYTKPTEIQIKAIPKVLEGKDLLATAQTGSGKTAAFVLPMLQQLVKTKPTGNRYPRALIMAPTRELAIQISKSIKNYGQYVDLYQVIIYGGVSQKPQVKRLRKGSDIVVGTPGRLIDLIKQGHLSLNKLDMFILDEADRMLDMGFMPDIKRVLREIPENRQTLMLSATIPKKIAKLAKQIQQNPVHLSVDQPSTTVETVDSYVYFVDKQDKFKLLLHLFETKPEMRKILIFRRTKYNCDKLMKKLKKKGYFADRIHGNRSQNQREKALRKFRNNNIDILIGTDVAARGLDVDDITHVINYEITNEPEVYVHRVGRTARAGKDGVAMNFCSKSEQKYIRDIEILTQEHMIRVEDHPHQSKKKKPHQTKLFGKSGNKNHHKKSKNGRNGRRNKKKYYRKNN